MREAVQIPRHTRTPVKAGGRPRPLAIVACDDTEDYERSAEALINDVRVPAIQGFDRSKAVLDLASRYFIPKNILALASDTASMISSISHEPEQPRTMFRVCFDRQTQKSISGGLMYRAQTATLEGI
jgi:hypothetical protein